MRIMRGGLAFNPFCAQVEIIAQGNFFKGGKFFVVYKNFGKNSVL